MRLLIVAAVCGAVAVTGCTTQDPYSGQSRTSKTAEGAGIGAVAGAVLGAATGKNAEQRRKRALEGAAIFGVAGAGVGAYMDNQDKKLRERLQGVGVGVNKDPNTGIITLVMPGNITFPTAQSSIKADFYPVLDAVADVLKEYNKTSITVSGYTDNVGKSDANLKLSQDRANSVSAYLQNRGVDGGRLSAVGMGESNFIGDNSNEAGRAKNRRVEVTINPPAQTPQN
jgi:outer membrane protein OmpA-like peptidoglycan-associated protein